MKKISALAALLILSGCSTTSSVDETQYDVEVSKPGYLTYRKWVVVDKKTILTVNLDEVAATEAAN